jgi:DHA1 family multidrug resistance protein-like MFS transporter
MDELEDRYPDSFDFDQGDEAGRDSLELDRIHTYQLQQQYTVGSTRSRTPRDQWLPLGAGKPHPPPLPDPEDYVVEFEGSDDPMHPQNWPMSKR